LIEEFNALIGRLSEQCEIKLIIGNHDKKLRSVLRDKAIELLPFVNVGKFLLLHGHSVPDGGEDSTVIMGHEHPAIWLGDGIKGARFPCFMLSERVLILPAFSLWTAGGNSRAHAFMSPIARRASFDKAVAICGGKLLPVKLK